MRQKYADADDEVGKVSPLSLYNYNYVVDGLMTY